MSRALAGIAEASAGARSKDGTVFVMKALTVFLGETHEQRNSEAGRNFHCHHPVWSGGTAWPHSAMLTDVSFQNEIARRVAPRLEALVAPPVGLSALNRIAPRRSLNPVASNERNKDSTAGKEPPSSYPSSTFPCSELD